MAKATAGGGCASPSVRGSAPPYCANRAPRVRQRAMHMRVLGVKNTPACPGVRSWRWFLGIVNAPPDPRPPWLGVGGGTRAAARSGRVLPVCAWSTSRTGRIGIVIENSAPDPRPPQLRVRRCTGATKRSGRILPVGAGSATRTGWIVVPVAERQRESRCP